jgi:hypothetical protein
MDKKANYKEEFSFNLNIDEAIYQNDEKFIDTLLEKRTFSKKTKRLKEEIKRNEVFTPENKEKINLSNIEEDADENKKESVKLNLGKRFKRLAEGEMQYGSKKLNLGEVKRIEDQKTQLELSFFSMRPFKVKDYQFEASSRINQEVMRGPGREKKSLSSIDKEKGLRMSSEEDEVYDEKIFRKVQSLPAVKIRKMKINEGRIVTSENTETHDEKIQDLFSKFLNNLQRESISKVKKGSVDSDIIRLFKSLQNDKSAGDKG